MSLLDEQATGINSWEQELAQLKERNKLDLPLLAPLLRALVELKHLPGDEGIAQFAKAAAQLSEHGLIEAIDALSDPAAPGRMHKTILPNDASTAEYLLWCMLGGLCWLCQRYEAAYSFYMEALSRLGPRGHNDLEVLTIQIGAVLALAHTGKCEESLQWLRDIQQDCEESLWPEEENLRRIHECRAEILRLSKTS